MTWPTPPTPAPYQVGATLALHKYICRSCDCQWWVNEASIRAHNYGTRDCPNCSAVIPSVSIDTMRIVRRTLR